MGSKQSKAAEGVPVGGTNVNPNQGNLSVPTNNPNLEAAGKLQTAGNNSQVNVNLPPSNISSNISGAAHVVVNPPPTTTTNPAPTNTTNPTQQPANQSANTITYRPIMNAQENPPKQPAKLDATQNSLRSDIRNKSIIRTVETTTVQIQSKPHDKLPAVKEFSNYQGKEKDIKQFTLMIHRHEAKDNIKESNYFDQSQQQKMEQLKKVYGDPSFASYNTGNADDMKTCQVNTYLFDRKLERLAA